MKKVSYVRYINGVSDYLQVVQDLEKLYVQMLHAVDVAELEKCYNELLLLQERADSVTSQIKANDFTEYNFREKDGCDMHVIKSYKKSCRKRNKELKKVKKQYAEYKNFCIKTYTDSLAAFRLGNRVQYIVPYNKEKLKLIVEKVQAEAKIKEEETKKHEAIIAAENAKQAEAEAKKAEADAKAKEEIAKAAQAEAQKKQAEAKIKEEENKQQAKIKEAEVKKNEAIIATENAKKAEADAKAKEEIAKAAQAEAQKKQAEAKIKEADAVIAVAEKAKADLAIEEHKTEQLRLQAEERKAREEEAILSVEERCKIMYNEFLNTLQGGIVNSTR